MKYTVAWKPAAERQLTEIWVEAADRDAVTVAANQADEILRKSPNAAGESRSERRRILILEPLVFQFEVSDDDLFVYVLRVTRIPVV